MIREAADRSHPIEWAITRNYNAPTEPIATEAVARFIKEGFLFLNIPAAVETSLRAAFDAGPPFFSQSLEEKMRATLPCDSGYQIELKPMNCRGGRSRPSQSDRIITKG
jgi:hypothetical protein